MEYHFMAKKKDNEYKYLVSISEKYFKNTEDF